MHIPVPVHVGHRLPRFDDERDDQVASTRRDFGEQVRVSALDKAEVDWSKHEIEPRWFGSETADCVAALQPGFYSDRGDSERDRFLAGTAERGETALVISMLGFAHDTPWWSLSLHGLTLQPMTGPPETYPAVGTLRPILVDPLGTPVVAVWVSPDEQIRWYVIPDDIDWNVVLDWLVHQAIPAYVPEAARRHRSSSFVDQDLLTSAERDAQQTLADMEIRHAEERQRLQATFDRARQDANPIREGLFYGTGDLLVRAVEIVLRAAGFDVVDLDTELGRTASADLLVTLEGHRRLVEVKSEGRHASESLVNDLLRHLSTWPELRPELPVGGGALVVNHQHRLPPDERTRAVYRR